MSKLSFWVAVFFSLAAVVAHAADADVGNAPVPPLSSDAERTRIKTERALAESAYQRGEAGCYARFVVTDCIRQLRRQRREVLDRLHKQEVAINDGERQRKAQERRDLISEKSSERKLAEAAAQRLEVQAAQQARVESATQKTNAAVKVKPAQPRVASKPQVHSRTADDIAKEKKQYKDKLREAELHRADRLKSNNERTGVPKKPLPQYP